MSSFRIAVGCRSNVLLNALIRSDNYVDHEYLMRRTLRRKGMHSPPSQWKAVENALGLINICVFLEYLRIWDLIVYT